MYKIFTIFLFFTLLSILTSCGYHFQGSRSILPEDIKTVYIAPVTNLTPEPGLGLKFTEVIRSTFERFGALRVVYQKRDADAIFKARIVSIENQTRSVTGATDIELELDLVMTISAELRRSSGQLLWSNPSYRASKSFASTSDSVVTSSADFASGSLSVGSLGGLDSREISRGQSEEVLDSLLEQTSRKLYLSSVASDF